MNKTFTRAQGRLQSARFLNSVPTETLWEGCGISRLSNITGFDVIGMPVFTSTRPLANSLSINSGKGLHVFGARAGAVAEAIEFCVAERPQRESALENYETASRHQGFSLVPPEQWHVVNGASLTDRDLFYWDRVSHISDLRKPVFLVPEDLIYIAEVTVVHLMRFHGSTNGWATGFNLADAALQGLYEVVERDSWTIWQWLLEQREVWPPKLDAISGCAAYPWFAQLYAKCRANGLEPVFFNMETDTALPVVWALLFDTNQVPAGVFGGFGCAFRQQAALKRAFCESIQSRACYVAGARDDLLRRSFLLMKRFNQQEAAEGFNRFPGVPFLPESEELELSAEAELEMIIQWLAERGFEDFYVKNAGQPFKDNPFSVAKVLAPCLENYKCGYWRPTKRLVDYVNKYVNVS